jgi:hypothetical protein
MPPPSSSGSEIRASIPASRSRKRRKGAELSSSISRRVAGARLLMSEMRNLLRVP